MHEVAPPVFPVIWRHERTETGKVVRESEECIRQLLENIREVFWMTDLEKNRVLYISAGYEAIWGRTRESLYASPRNWLEAVHPEDRPRVQRAALAQQHTGEYNEVYRIVRPDRSIRWIQDRAFPVRDESGKVYRMAGIAEDITGRKAMEQVLRESEARKVAIMESALDGILTIDSMGRVTEFNSAAEHIFRCRRARMIGRELAAVMFPTPLREWFRSGLVHAFLGAEGPTIGRRMKMTALRSDGTEFPIEFTLTRLELEGPPLFTVFIRDITERQRTEHQVRLLANAVESTEEFIAITDCEGRFLYVNQAFLKAYGYAEEEVLGRTPEILRSANNPPALVRQILSETLRGGWRGEMLNRRKDGSEFCVFLSTSAIRDSQGRIIGLVGVASDVSARKHAEKRNAVFGSLTRRLSAATTPAGAARIIMDVAAELFGWDAGYVDLYSHAQDRIIPVLNLDTVNGRRIQISPTSFSHVPSPMMRLVMQGRGRLINRAGHPPPTVNLVPFGDASRPSASMMYVPIHSRGTAVGILSIQSYTPQAYGPEDLTILQALADHCGEALERINVTEALRESEEQFRTLFESAPIGMALHQADGKHLQTNRAYQKMLGYTDEELLGLRIGQLTHPHDLPEGEQYHQELLSGRRDHYCREHRFGRKDGRVVWAKSKAYAVRDPQGGLRFVVSMVEDVTEHYAAEERIRQLASIMDSALEAIIGTSLQGVIANWNPAAERLYGFTAAEILGKPISMLAGPGQVDKSVRLLDAVGGGDGIETVHQRKDGERIDVSLTVSPILDHSGKSCGVSVIARDITERKRLEQEVLEISAAERREIGFDLHDGVGQHLAATAFKAKLLEETLAADFPQLARSAREVVSLINAGVDQVRRVARGLDLIEIEATGLESALSQLAEDTRTVFGIPCVCRCTQPVPRFDPTVSLQLYRIAQEAIHNALAHGRARRVEIELAFTDARTSLMIADDGCGFLGEAISRAGMGQRIMKHRARAIGGTLLIDSQVNRGTRITCLVQTPRRRPTVGQCPKVGTASAGRGNATE